MKGKKKKNMKETICTITGAVGATIASFFGGWTAAMTTLVIFMIVDYITGIVVAAVFKRSSKTESGGLQSKAGFKGLCKKALILTFVLIAYRLDVTIGTNYIKDAVCIGFMANELLSIIENAGTMGVPIPSIITNAIDALKNKGDKK